jgi:hypothetical protein
MPKSLHPHSFGNRVKGRDVPESENAHDRFQLLPPRQAAVSAEHGRDRLMAHRIAIVAVLDIPGDPPR